MNQCVSKGHLAALVAFVSLCFSCDLASADELKAKKQSTFFRTGVIVAAGNIENQSILCLLDTGASATVLHKDLEKVLPVRAKGKEEDIQTLSATERRVAYENLEVSIGAYGKQKSRAFIFDLSNVQEVTGLQVGAIVGADYLRNLAFVMHGGAPKFTNSPIAPTTKVTTWPISGSEIQIPEIPLEYPVLGLRNAGFDTGLSEHLAISQEFADLLLRSGDARFLTKTKHVDASGIQTKTLIAIRELKVMGVQFRNVPAEVGKLNHVGMGLLRHIDFTVDFRKSIAYLNGDAQNGRDEFPVDASGIRFVWDDRGYYRIRRIEDGSSAKEADLKLDDELVAISEIQASTLSRWQIREMLAVAGTMVEMKVRRKGNLVNVKLPLQRSFQYPPTWSSRSTEAGDFLDALQRDSANDEK
jgi:predicted aspartyl protease